MGAHLRVYLFWTLILMALPIIWRRPFWGILLYCFFNIIRPEVIFWGGHDGSKVLTVLLGIVIITTIVNNSDRMHKIKPSNIPTIYLILYIYLGLLFSTLISSYNPDYSNYGQTQIGYLNEILKIFIVCLFIVLYVETEKEIKTFEFILVGAIFFLSIWGIEQYFKGNLRLEGIAGDSYMDSNGVAAMFVLFAPVAMSFIKFDSKYIKIFGIISFSTILIAIVCTSSRGGTVGMAFALIITLLKSKKKLKYSLICFIVLIISMPYFSSEYKERITSLSSVETIDYSGKSRFVLWKTALKIFYDNPIFGVGFLTFKDAKMAYKYDLDIAYELREYAFRPGKVGHSTYLQILAEGGLVSSIPYFLLIILTIINNNKLRTKVNDSKNDHELNSLLSGIDTGILGFCICIISIDALIDVMFPIHITICLIIRKIIETEYIKSSESRLIN